MNHNVITDEPVALPGDTSSLGLLRQQITTVDQQLLILLAERQRLVLQVGQCKLQQQLPFYDPQREQQLLQILLASGQQQQLATEYITQVFQVIFRHALVLQQQLSIEPTLVDDNQATRGFHDHNRCSPLSSTKRPG
ncbi:chorismate mutase [unidentified bacterial endosymbiont]|uniref:chorismate mutase n=1 Tax=unidentified bacterial endosymbiont TaxID=2355 RepID=UPI0020A1927B|nr:chorismate mutase [unidentified bacterial endosymbiont]